MQFSNSTVKRDISLLFYLIQRISGVVLAILLFTHLLTVVYAVNDGLTVSEITARLQDSTVWFVFYGLFVLAAVTHSMIGIRNILLEMAPFHRRVVDTLVLLYIIISLYFGLQAMMAFWSI